MMIKEDKGTSEKSRYGRVSAHSLAAPRGHLNCLYIFQPLSFLDKRKV